jgi:hypothetical protein
MRQQHAARRGYIKLVNRAISRWDDLLGLRDVLLHSLLVHGIQDLDGKFDVADQSVTSALAEIFTHNNAHKLELLAVWGHRVCWYNPSTLAQLVGNLELVIHL